MTWVGRRLSPAVLVFALVACSGPNHETLPRAAVPGIAPQPASEQAVDLTNNLVATARSAVLSIHDSPGGRASEELTNPTPDGGPRVLRVVRDAGQWLEVSLAGRPNGRTGWVSAGDVNLAVSSWHLVVELGRHRLSLFQGPVLLGTYPVGVGAAVTPTPTGTYYLTDLLRPPKPDGAYGPYAFGLSAYSTVLTSFGGGPGQIGLHGTDDPTSVGRTVSHGCLRITNALITQLAYELPLGTPVVITR